MEKLPPLVPFLIQPTMIRLAPFLLVPLTILLTLGCAAPSGGLGPNDTVKFRSVISSGLDYQENAKDNVQSVDTSNGRVYLQTTWYDLPEKAVPYSYRVELYDGSGDLVHNSRDRFDTAGAGYVTTTWYTFRPIDAPGFWKWKIYLDHQCIAEKPLLVTQRSAGGSLREF